MERRIPRHNTAVPSVTRHTTAAPRQLTAPSFTPARPNMMESQHFHTRKSWSGMVKRKYCLCVFPGCCVTNDWWRYRGRSGGADNYLLILSLTGTDWDTVLLRGYGRGDNYSVNSYTLYYRRYSIERVKGDRRRRHKPLIFK